MANTASTLKYRADIDGLRAISILVVVVFHAFPDHLKGGFIGVDVFFVISGYLITSLIFEDLKDGYFNFSRFYQKRVLRLFPALLLVALTCFVFGWFALFSNELESLGKHIAGSSVFALNLLLISEVDYFGAPALSKPVLHLWSLSVEEQFYAIWPLLLWFSWKRKFNILLVIIIVAAISFSLSAQSWFYSSKTAYFSSLNRFWELMCGAILAYYSNHPHTLSKTTTAINQRLTSIIANGRSRAAYPFVENFLSTLGFFTILIAAKYLDQNAHFPGVWALTPVLGAMLIISAGSNAIVNRIILSGKPAVWLGLISYPLYLWHWPVLSFARIISGEMPSREFRVCAVLASIIAAWLTYRFVELPLKTSGHRTTTVKLLVISMLLIGSFGLFVHIFNGIPSRSTVKAFTENHMELIRPSPKDELCLGYIRTPPPSFNYCRFNDVGSNYTVAVIGDSHAHAAYTGLAELLEDHKKNTLLLANSSCPPFYGAPTGRSKVETENCRININQILDELPKHPDINIVLFFTRGPIYLSGQELARRHFSHPVNGILSKASFKEGLQNTTDIITNAGIQVVYITENPELSYDAEACQHRPLRLIKRDCRKSLQAVRSRQDEYFQILQKISGIHIIDSTEFFCADESICSVFKNGKLLYADDNHLSISGRRFQADALYKLHPYIFK